MAVEDLNYRATRPISSFIPAIAAGGSSGGFGDNGPGYTAAAMACVRRRFKTLSTAHART